MIVLSVLSNCPAVYNKNITRRDALLYRRKTDFFPEEDTPVSYSGFEPEPTRLQAEDHSHHTVWVKRVN
ncbi:hypothetical protein TNCV_2329171 [Trichonephila clavipes]|nr:hypothetical protein TNCV_2329171 [Trichonephila clavipes]